MKSRSTMIPFINLRLKHLAGGALLLGMVLLWTMSAMAQSGAVDAKNVGLGRARSSNEKKTLDVKPKPVDPLKQARELANQVMSNAPMAIAPGTELIEAHMNSEMIAPIENYWDGVDNGGNLHVFVAEDRVLNDVGVFQNTGFPPSVSVADMNGDQLPDLVVGDLHGYLRIYMNSGKKGKPQFTTNILVQTFLGLNPRIYVTDWDGDMDNDIIFGTFYGDFQVLRNIGTVKEPRFTSSMGLPRFCEDPVIGLPRLMLGKDPLVLGIYTAPWVMDWDKDGKKDLIFGEGTYSANSVRIAFNSGSAAKPMFTEESVFFLAYGEGYEQLVPSVVDYNGDSIPDLMCGTRTGQIRLYKGTGKTIDAKQTFRGIKEPAAMDFDYNLLIDNLEVLETMSAPFPYDMNEDGLFDIVMGSKRGVIYMILNEGTKAEPLFQRVNLLQGLNNLPDLVAPMHWMGTVGRDGNCNSTGYLTAEKAIVLATAMPPVEPEKKDFNQTVQPVVRPVEGDYFLFYRYMQDYPGWAAYPNEMSRLWGHFGYFPSKLPSGSWLPGARTLGTRNVAKMTIGKQYTFSFSYIFMGRGAVDWKLTAWENFKKYNDEYDDYDGWNERRDVSDRTLKPTGGAWQKVTVNFTCPGKQRGQKLTFPMITLPGVGVAQELTFSIGFLLPEGDSQLCLDDFSLKEVGGMPLFAPVRPEPASSSSGN